MAEYTFQYSQTSAAIPKAGGLFTELNYVLGTQLVTGIDSDDETATLTISTAITLDAQGEGALNAVVGAHQGITYPTPILKGSSKLVQEIQDVKTIDDWYELAGVLAKPSMLVKNLSSMVGEVNGQYRCTGTGAQIQVCETREDTSHIELVTKDLVSTGDVWMPFAVQITTDQAGLNLYELKGRRRTAHSLAIRFSSLYLFELL